jgi:xyloglucan-specific endo-beta-1,4-glucanase
MKAPILTTTALLTTLAATSPTIAARQATPNCEQWGSIVTGEYTIYNNLWGASSANPGGKQCFSVTSLIGNSVTWSTT